GHDCDSIVQTHVRNCRRPGRTYGAPSINPLEHRCLRNRNYNCVGLRILRREEEMICLGKSVRVAVVTMVALCQFSQTADRADRQATTAPVALPAPTGPFAVGRVTVHWTDTSRFEPLAADHGYRELMVDIW